MQAMMFKERKNLSAQWSMNKKVRANLCSFSICIFCSPAHHSTRCMRQRWVWYSGLFATRAVFKQNGRFNSIACSVDSCAKQQPGWIARSHDQHKANSGAHVVFTTKKTTELRRSILFGIHLRKCLHRQSWPAARWPELARLALLTGKRIQLVPRKKKHDCLCSVRTQITPAITINRSHSLILSESQARSSWLGTQRGCVWVRHL